MLVMRRETATIVIGAGQAALSLSRQLAAARHDHVLLERGRVGEAWLRRWDSLHLLTPNWLNRLDGAPAHAAEHGFLKAGDFTKYLQRYARSFGAPVYEHTTVERVSRLADGFLVETDGDSWRAGSVVVATGHAGAPRVPAASAGVPLGLRQLHSSAYRNPSALPPGGVLVVGAGPSGQQIAAELRRAGRRVVIAVGEHARSMRRYRGRDIWHWLRETGAFDRTREDLGPGFTGKTTSLTLSGTNGGEQLDLAVLDRLGVVVAGRLVGFDGARATFADDLEATTTRADLAMLRTLDRIDAHLAVVEPEWPHRPRRVRNVSLGSGPSWVDLSTEGISTVIWATGYGRDYSWLDVPALGENGEIEQRHGVAELPGLYTIGLNFQRYRGSHLIGGVGADAALLARQIAAAGRRAPAGRVSAPHAARLAHA
jgi:putative flavoprotein involved in K+ transport